MSKNSFEGEREIAKPRRFAGEADREVLRYLINTGKPVKWGDIQRNIKGMSPKVLSSALKRLRGEKYVETIILDDKKNRPMIHYYVVEELPFGDYSEMWHDIFASARKWLKKKGLSKKQRVAILYQNFYGIFLAHQATYLGALRAALKSNDEEAKKIFPFLFSTLISDPSNMALFLCLENRDIANEALENLSREIKKQISIALRTQRREKGTEERRR